MTVFTKLGNEIFSPVDSAGNPRQPVPQDAQVWTTTVERMFAAFQAGGGIVFATKAEADASLNYAANQMAWVIGDSVTANNGVYRKIGSAGSGSWVRLGDLPYSFIQATNAGTGTPNAIQATTPVPVPAANGGALITLPIVATNTSDSPTVEFNGDGNPLTITDLTGSPYSAGALELGMVLAGYKVGSTFRVLIGPRGWSPLLRVVSDGARRVFELYDWTGGQGAKPAATGYLGAAGLTQDISQAVDVRGPAGPNGPGTGDMLKATYDPGAVEADAFDSVNHKFRGPETDEVQKTVYLNLIETVRVSRWGVDPSQTAAANTLQLQKAIAAKEKAELVFQGGDYHFNDLITVPDASIYIAGQGQSNTRLIQDNLTASLLKFDLRQAMGAGLHGMTLTSNVASFGDPGSTGIALAVKAGLDNFTAKDFDIVSFGGGIEIQGGYQPRFDNFRVLFFSYWGIHFAPFTGIESEIAGSSFSRGKVSNNGLSDLEAAEASIGLWIEQSSGEFFDTIDFQQMGLAVVVAPPAGSWARFLKFKTVLADTSYYEGWLIDGTHAPTFNIRCVDCWSAGSGGGANRPAGSARGAGLLTKGANLDDFSWIGGELRDNDVHGWDHQGGTNCRMIGASVARNSRRLGFDNTYHGVRVAAGVSEWALIGNRIGNFSEGVFSVTQHNSVHIESGASENFTIIGNDLRSPGSGGLPLANQSTSQLYVIRDNLPQQFPGTNNDRGANLMGVSVGTVAAGSTVYLGPAGQQANEGDAFFMIGRPGIVSQILVEVTNAPGAGQSFTYMVRRNETDTVMTGQIAGESSFILILPTPFPVSSADRLSVRLITSSGAAAARHRFVINVDA